VNIFPEKIFIIRPNIDVQSAESHISLGLMNGFLELNLNCKIIDNIKKINDGNEKTLIIDDLSNYKSESVLNHAKFLSRKGLIIALWVHWPIYKDSKFYEFHKKLIINNLNWFQIIYGEREHKSMKKFEDLTKRKYITIPNASPSLPKNFLKIRNEDNHKNNFDVVFIGSKMKSKSFLFNKVLPLLRKKNPNLKIGLFGRGFNKRVRISNGIIKFSNKFIKPLSKKLNFFVNMKMKKLNEVISSEREILIYRNSKICINYHENTPEHIIYNLRYFKIPYYGGFQLVDSPLNKSPYFDQDEVIHIDSDEAKIWVEKIIYYLNNPIERNKIQKNGNRRAISFHSYKNRARKFLNLYSDLLNKK
tara:strand:+ start:1149 stop:2231 length:1083 start_codon:yes stop_codon:yes gene_type:complete